MSSPAPRALLLRELPLVLGVLLGVAFVLHPGFERFGYPDGADWDTYLSSSAQLWLDRDAHRYNEWRLPLYPWLVGLFGQFWSYVHVGQVLALAGTAAVVLGAGLLARALATPWAGGLAALATASTPLVLEGSWWVNPYPMVAGAGALALGCGVGCARWPRAGWALLAGGFAGLALATDLRSVPVAAAVPPLVALGPGPPRRRLALAGLALAAILAWEGADQGLRAAYGLRLRSFRSQLVIQHTDQPGIGAPLPPRGVLDASACERSLGDRRPTPFGPCAGLRRTGNYGYLASVQHLPPLLPALAFLALALVPASWGRRSSLAAALVWLPSLAALFVGMSVVVYPQRYVLPFAPLLTSLAPVAFARVVDLAGRRRPARWLGVAGALATAGWLALGWPGFRPGELLQPVDTFERRGASHLQDSAPREALRRWALRAIRRGDLLVECAELRLAVAILPERRRIVDFPPHSEECRRAILAPDPAPGTTWLLTLHTRLTGPDPRLVTPERAAAAGWVELPLEGEVGDRLERVGIRRWQLAPVAAEEVNRSAPPPGTSTPTPIPASR